MRESWTDERLDDLNGNVVRGFERLDGDLRALRVETRTEFAAVRDEMRTEFAAVRGEMRTEFAAVRGEMKAGFDRIDARFDTMQRTMIQVGGGMIAALCAGLLGLIATQI